MVIVMQFAGRFARANHEFVSTTGLESEIYAQALARPGDEVKYDADGKVCKENIAEELDSALVRIEHWKPERVFQGQENQVMVSVWKHAK